MDAPTPAETEHRFLVRSAEEAVQIIREQLGEHAQVTSVRRVERGGLKGLIRGAQLEVIARVPTPPPRADLRPLALPAAAPETTSSLNPWDADDAPLTIPAVPERESLRSLQPAELPTKPDAPEPIPAPPAPTESSRLTALLRRVGLSDLLLARLQARPEFQRAERLALASALPEGANLLRQEFAAAQGAPLGTRVAFVGMAGAGSTSLLCKHLARTVFSLGQRAAVFRLETDRPNPIDGLSAVCELWGVPLLRSDEEMPAVRDGTRLYVDVPGLTDPADAGEEAKIAARLEKLAVPDRVFVLNAAYEPAILKGLYRRATALGCKHLAFSHLDELVHWGKLWEFLLHRDLSTKFYSLGASVPGEFTDEVLETALGKTFV